MAHIVRQGHSGVAHRQRARLEAPRGHLGGVPAGSGAGPGRRLAHLHRRGLAGPLRPTLLQHCNQLGRSPTATATAMATAPTRGTRRQRQRLVIRQAMQLAWKRFLRAICVALSSSRPCRCWLRRRRLPGGWSSPCPSSWPFQSALRSCPLLSRRACWLTRLRMRRCWLSLWETRGTSRIGYHGRRAKLGIA
jgi:hypothetical protein